MPNYPALPAFAADQPTSKFTEAAAQTFLLGAAVLLDGSNNVAECGVDPAAILGFAAHPAGKNIPNTEDLVWRASEGQKFWMSGAAGAPVKANINVSYGITKGADGIWQLDTAKTAGSARLYVHNIDLDRNLFLVSVLAANRQTAP